MINRNSAAVAAMFLLVGACAREAPADQAAGTPAERHASAEIRAAPGARRLGTEVVEARFTGWDLGDYAWARLKIEGRDEIGAWSGPSPIDLFLDAHIGRPITIRLERLLVEVPEAGGKTEVYRVADARIGALTAEAWWSSLSPKQRQDAQISLAGSLEPRPPAER